MLSTDQNPSSSCPQTTSPPANSNSDYEKNTSGNNHNAPLAKFSIRDYVRNTRGKDIVNHWPFSQKNLQLCLKHGVHNVLPPFQALDSVRNSSTVESTNENIKNSDVKLSGLNNVGEKLAYKSSVSKQGKEIFSNLFKKSRLIVKSSISTEPKPNEELSVSETMASKVCPVCKTFSSSSNTTLNAHIDQCLSSESTVKWTADSRVVKHRIKQRKTRSMADVYATSVECTLDDLDQRNGTNWASSSDSPTQDTEMCADEENYTKNDAIHFDSNGTKLQMLSRFNNLQATLNTKHDYQDTASKLASRMKKKQRSSCPCPKQTYHEVNKRKQRKFGDEAHKNEESAQPLEALDQMRFNYYGVVKQRVGSKKTIAKTKIDREHERQSPNKTIDHLLANSNLPCKRTCLVMEQPHLRKIRHCNRSIPSLSECTAEQLKKSDGPSVYEYHADPPSGEESHTITSDFAMLSQDKKLPCLRKTIRTIRRTSLQQLNMKPRKKFSDVKEPRQLRTSGSAVEAIIPAVSTSQTATRAEKFSHKLLGDQANVLTTAKKRDSMNSTKHGGMASKSSDTSQKSDAIKDVEIHEGFIRDPSSKGEAFLNFVEGFETSFRGLTEQHSHAEQEIFGADKDGLRSDGENPGDYFVDADPIPIPGPPGSFLPSPGQMGSEELRGNSSLTTYRVHSSEEHGRIDMDLSDSPVSAMSSASRLYSTSILNSMDESHCMQNEPQHDISENQTDKNLRLDESSTFKNALPCCCFMKEGIVKERSSFNYQLSELQGQQTVASYERQVEHDPAREEKTLAANSLMGNSEAKLQLTGDCALPSPPVLRLMGKNLTIVNKDEILSKNLHEQVQACVTQLRTGDSSPDNKSKERILISGSPVPGSNLGYEGMVNMEASVRISASMDVSNNPFYNYQARCFPTYDVSSQTVQNATTRASTTKMGMNENSVNWDPTSPGGSSVLHPAASWPSTTDHLRSASLYLTSAGFFMPKNFTC